MVTMRMGISKSESDEIAKLLGIEAQEKQSPQAALFNAFIDAVKVAVEATAARSEEQARQKKLLLLAAEKMGELGMILNSIDSDLLILPYSLMKGLVDEDYCEALKALAKSYAEFEKGHDCAKCTETECGNRREEYKG